MKAEPTDDMLPTQERTENTDEAILKEARDRAAYAMEYWHEQHLFWEEDLRFIDGDQWDAQAKLDRKAEGRPTLTINTLPGFIDQVLNDGLQNRPAISVHPSDSTGATVKVASEDGLSNYTLAQTIEGIIRNSEYVYGAEHHFDTSLQHGIETGMGWLRVITKYANNMSMDQDVAAIGVRNRFSVLMDPDAKEPDMSDANYCFILQEMHRKEYDRLYPGQNSASVTVEAVSHQAWVTVDKVRVAEYYTREPTTRELIELTSGEITWRDKLELKIEGKKVSVLDDLAAQGITIKRSRKVKTWKVYRRLITGFAILEDAQEWVGSTIPVVPVAGKRVDYPDKTIYRGLTHHSKDAKRAENFYVSAAVERIGLSPKAPWTVEAGHIEGFEHIWDTANTKNHPYLVYNPGPGGTKPQRTEPATMPVAELQMAAVMTDKVKATIGIYDASLGAQSNEVSGRAILARKKQSDTGTFVFLDNLAKALRRVGIIMTEVIPQIMDGERVVRLRDRDGSGDWVKINSTVIDKQTGTPIIINDIQAGKMDVVVTTGPSYATQRMEATEALLEFVRVVPAAGAVILDKIAANMDWPGAQELAGRLIKIIPQNVLTEKEIADAGITPPEPTPEQQVLMAQAKAASDTAAATSAMAQAKTLEAQAKMAEINSLAAGGGELEKRIQQIVTETVASLIASANTPPSPTLAPTAPIGA